MNYATEISDKGCMIVTSYLFYYYIGCVTILSKFNDILKLGDNKFRSALFKFLFNNFIKSWDSTPPPKKKY